MSDVLLYTSIFGAYDDLKEVPTQTRSHDSLCCTDQTFTSTTWKVVSSQLRFGGDTMLTSRYHKINGLDTDHNWCIYLDGSFQITSASFIQFMLDQLSDHDFVFFAHPWRRCLYDEADVCMTIPKYNHGDLRMQVAKYARNDMPKGYGLWACGCFAYRKNKGVGQFQKAWWSEIIKTSSMDQVSLPYVLKSTGFWENVGTIELDIFNNELISYSGHKMDYVDKQQSQVTNMRWWLSRLSRH